MLNQIKNNVRSLFLSSAMLIGGAAGLSGCTEGDDPKPVQPTELKGRIDGFTIQTAGDELVSGGMIVENEKNEQVIFSMSLDSKTKNATLTFSEFDPITERSQISAAYDNSVALAVKNKPLTAVIRFDENADPTDTKGYKEIRVTADELSRLVIQPWDQSEVQSLLDRDRFKQKFKNNLIELGDADPATPGSQPVRLTVWLNN